MDIDITTIKENNYFPMPRKARLKSPQDNEKNKEFLRLLEEKINEKPRGTKKFIAESLGLSPGWLSKKLKGDRGMDVLDLIKIADILKISPGRLLPESPFNKESEDEEILEKIRDVLTPELFNKLLKMEPKKIGGLE